MIKRKAPLLATCILTATLAAASGRAAEPPRDGGARPDGGIREAGGPDAGVSDVKPDAVVERPADAAAGRADPAGQPSPPAAAAPAIEPATGERTTGIRGRIVDSKSGVGIEAAPVVVSGQGGTHSALTGPGGAYEAFVPPGSYTVRSYFDLYHGVRIDRIRVTRGKLTEVNLTLDPVDEAQEVAVEEIEIPYRAEARTAAAQDQLRRASSGIGEGIGAQQMSQAGASDASSAAARVVGVSIESAQVIIRGLGGRYNRVLLNGVPVPSVDPDVPGVDLDLFPTSVIESLTISKTFLPDMPADFAGGVMEIKSVSFPRKFTLELDVGGALSSQSTFRDRVDYRGGKYDALGYDDGRRSIPDATARRQRPGFLTDTEAEAFRNVWQYDRRQAMPKMGLDLTVGDSILFGRRRRFGYLLSAGYEHDSVRKVGLSRPNPGIAMDGSLVERNNYRVETGAEDVQLSSLATASLDLGLDHSMTVLSLFNRGVSDETLLLSGTSADIGGLEKWQLQYLARTLWFNQIFGDHRNLAGTRLRLRWAGFHAYGERDEPDRRTVAYGLFGGNYEWLDTTASGTRFYSGLRQDDVGGSLSLRFPLWSEAWGTIGGASQLSTRDFTNRRFRMRKHQNNADGTAYRRPVEELFNADGIGTLTEMQDATRDDDSYESRQAHYATYLLIETPLVGPLSLAGGVRAEVLSQKVESRSPFPTGPAAGAMKTDRKDVDYLPGAALKYQLTDQMLLRAAYGLTVARPQIRELAPYDYYDFLRDRSVVGNPNLKRTLVHNADLRWEWFFAEGQIVALSAFYKQFIDPIELTILDNVTGSSKFNNGTSARNLGGELELRFNFGRLTRGLRWFNFDGNLALVQSRIELPANLTAVRSSRPLTGQSPYVTNLSLRFHEETRDVTAALVYNVVGPRISDVATLLGDVIPPDIEERPFHSLDFVGSARAGKHMKVKLKVRNILLQKRELRQGDFLIQRSEPGISASLGLTVAY